MVVSMAFPESFLQNTLNFGQEADFHAKSIRILQESLEIGKINLNFQKICYKHRYLPGSLKLVNLTTNYGGEQILLQYSYQVDFFV